MELLSILQNTLTAIGGGSGNPHTEYVRHVIPMILWGSLFVMAYTLRPVSSQRDHWFLGAIASAFLIELTQFILKSVMAANADWAVQSALMDVIARFCGPLIEVWTGITYCLLAFVTCRFIGFCKFNDKPKHVILLAAYTIFCIGSVVTIFWIQRTASGDFQPFKSSVESAILSSLYVSLLCATVLFFWRARNSSIVSRIAWPPFAFYLISELLLLIAATSNHVSEVWMLSISNNLKIWAAPWFGHLFWRYAIDEQRRLVMKLHQAERMDGVGRLAAGVVHDFNNHLQAILGFASVASLESGKDEQHQQRYNSILECVERSRVLIKLLTGFKREASDDEISDVSLKQVIFDLRPLLHSLLGPTVSTECHLDPEADNVRVGRSMLEQVIVNVVINARDVMPNGGTLSMVSETLDTTASEYSSPMIRLTISDSGPGVSLFESSQVFEPFYTTKSTTGGTGLGLTASREAIRRVGGNMTLVSKVGHGTTLIIDIPASDKSVQSGTDEKTVLQLPLPNPVSLGGTERILLVDDEPAVRHIATTILRREGYDVVVARDGEQALKLLSSNYGAFDAMILDILMPKKNGYEVFRSAKAMHLDIPAIFITGNALKINRMEPNEVHLAKPFTPQMLLQAVRTKLNEHEITKIPVKPLPARKIF